MAFNVYHNFEIMPDGNLRTFHPKICCTHEWSFVKQMQDEDDQTVNVQECLKCGAGCLRDPKTGALVDYDNTERDSAEAAA